VFSVHAEPSPKLFGEGPALQAAHTFLFEEFIEGRNCEYRPSGESRLLVNIPVWTGTVAVDGPTDIELDAGTEQIAHMFRYFVIKGKGLTKIDTVALQSFQPDVSLNRSTREENLVRVKTPGLGVPTAETPRCVLRLTGKGQVDGIWLKAFSQGLPRQFDDLPYRNLGHDQPVEAVAMTLHSERERSLDGHVALDRSKWFRYYGTPNAIPPALENWAKARGFSPGRQIFKFQPALVRGYGNKNPTLGEDPARAGFADPAFFDGRYNFDRYKDSDTRWDGLDFAMCFNDWPDFMAVPHVGRGTPLEQHFPAAAELAVRYLKAQQRDSDRTASWWELKNEATIKSEWDYHWRPGVDSWELMSRFHNTVADRVHREVPGVKIGGPASAWMQVQVKNFDLWRSQVQFMDQTRGRLDFYSHHFYEGPGTLGAHARLGRGYNNYLLGRGTAILDMFAAHMDATDNRKPILITEYGSLNTGSSDADYWLHLRSYNAYLLQWMQRPQQIDLAVPFVFVASPWDPKNSHAVFVPKDKPTGRWGAFENYQATPNQYLFELWRDFGGRRIAFAADAPWLSSVATLNDDGRVIQVALCNMSGRRRSIRLEGLSAFPIANATQRRLFRLDGEIRYEEAAPVKLAAVPLEVEESCVLRIELAGSVKPKETALLRSFHAPQTAVATDGNFVVKLPEDALKALDQTELVVGLFRRGGLDQAFTAFVNGTEIEHHVPWANGMSELFAPVRVPVPAGTVKADNTIRFDRLPAGTTITSVHLETTTLRPVE